MNTSQIRFTRAQYMSGEVTHQDYYGQFVTPSLLSAVKDFKAPRKDGIGIIGIHEFEDKWFNDVAVKYWYNLTAMVVHPGIRRHLREAEGQVSQACLVCVVKEAARQIRGW